eukprot:513176-Alexandrium_andersonii.AAC.1
MLTGASEDAKGAVLREPESALGQGRGASRARVGAWRKGAAPGKTVAPTCRPAPAGSRPAGA